MNLECRRWAALADLDALGEPVPSEGQAFQRAHEASCADCAREAALFRASRVREDDAPVEQGEIDGILSLVAAERARQASSLRRWKGALVFVGGATACAAAIFLWFGGKLARPHGSEGGQPRLPTAALVDSHRPGATPTPAASKQPLESDAAPRCSSIVAGATICMAGGTVLGRRELSGPQRELEVARGRAVVSLAPQAPGTSFSLTTISGKVTAVGTIFSVEVGADGGTIARVLEGKVLVQGRGESSAHPVHAGQAFHLGEQEPTPLSDQERDLDLALLARAEPNERGASPASSAAKAPARAAGHAPRPDMLEYARSLRANGDFRGAAEVYRKLHTESPQSPSGRAALVSLGELLLTLGDPQGALNAFDAYLVGAGALSQEATFGRVRALRALHQNAEEQRAIQRFLAAYPDAPQSRVLRARLAAIQK